MNGEEIKRQINDAYDNDDMCSRYDLVEAVEDVVDENSKLWKLAKGYETLAEALCNERECDGCPFDDHEQIVCEHMRLQTFLSELEIKEDE